MFRSVAMIIDLLVRSVAAQQKIAAALDDIAELQYRDQGLRRAPAARPSPVAPLVPALDDDPKQVSYATDESSFLAEQRDRDHAQEHDA